MVLACLILTTGSSFAQSGVWFTAVERASSNEVQLTWSTDTHRWFAVERTVELDEWSYELDFVIPDGPPHLYGNQWTIAANENSCFFRVLGSPPIGPEDVVQTSLGTTGIDTQLLFGVTNMDYILISGQSGADNQYASGNAGDDWLAELGGAGEDSQVAMGGSGNDLIYQDGGDDADILISWGGSDADVIIQRGGEGEDNMDARGGSGDDAITAYGNQGDDTIRVDPNTHDDVVEIHAGAGSDSLQYILSPGKDTATIDGGPDSDTLVVDEMQTYIDWVTNAAYLIQDQDGNKLYKTGTPDTVITVIDVDLICIVGTNRMTNWSWP